VESVVVRLNEGDRIKLRRFIDEYLSTATKFDKTGKPEYFVKMNGSLEKFMKHLSS